MTLILRTKFTEEIATRDRKDLISRHKLVNKKKNSDIDISEYITPDLNLFINYFSLKTNERERR